MNIIEKWKFGKIIKNISISKIDSLSGIEFEEFVCDLFSYLGFKSSLTPPSGDNGIDIVAKNRHFSIGIQTKLYYNHNVNNKAVQEVFSGKSFFKLDYAMVITNWSFSNPALNLANNLNVITIDRLLLKKILKNNKSDNIRLINKLVENTKNKEQKWN